MDGQFFDVSQTKIYLVTSNVALYFHQRCSCSITTSVVDQSMARNNYKVAFSPLRLIGMTDWNETKIKKTGLPFNRHKILSDQWSPTFKKAAYVKINKCGETHSCRTFLYGYAGCRCPQCSGDTVVVPETDFGLSWGGHTNEWEREVAMMEKKLNKN